MDLDPTPTAVDFSGRSEVAALAPSHKAEAIRLLASAAVDAKLDEVRLDGVDLDIACSEALGKLLGAPRLRVLSVADNKLNDVAVQRLARALSDHSNLQELSIGSQNGTRCEAA